MDNSGLISPVLLNITGIILNLTTLETTTKENRPLFLSPYIKEGKIQEAWRDSRVNMNHILVNSHITEHIESYSGYLTVNSTYNSNLFFWFFPAQILSSTAPLVLFLVGGPGAPATSEVFLNGPLEFDDEGAVHLRSTNTSWTHKHSVIYLDSPVGSGFSFTDDPRGYSKTDEEIAENIYAALTQFFQIFFIYKTRPFYVAGLSDGGKFGTVLAYKIDQENKRAGYLKINMKGMLLLSPLLDPVIQSRLAQVHYTFGLYDEKTLKLLQQLEDVFAELVKNPGEVIFAAKLIDDMYGVNVNTSSIFNQKSGYESIYEGLLSPKVPLKRLAPRHFIQQTKIRDGIHAGNSTFLSNSPKVVMSLLQDLFKSVRPQLEGLLASTDPTYKIWIVNGQLDLAVPSTNTDNFLRQLNWKDLDGYLDTDQVFWKIEEEIVGYFKQFKNFNHVILRLAGHILYFDVPTWTAGLLTEFLGTN